jgi:hypothetical protein
MAPVRALTHRTPHTAGTCHRCAAALYGLRPRETPVALDSRDTRGWDYPTWKHEGPHGTGLGQGMTTDVLLFGALIAVHRRFSGLGNTPAAHSCDGAPTA